MLCNGLFERESFLCEHAPDGPTYETLCECAYTVTFTVLGMFDCGISSGAVSSASASVSGVAGRDGRTQGPTRRANEESIVPFAVHAGFT